MMPLCPNCGTQVQYMSEGPRFRTRPSDTEGELRIEKVSPMMRVVTFCSTCKWKHEEEYDTSKEPQ